MERSSLPYPAYERDSLVTSTHPKYKRHAAGTQTKLNSMNIILGTTFDDVLLQSINICSSLDHKFFHIDQPVVW